MEVHDQRFRLMISTCNIEYLPETTVAANNIHAVHASVLVHDDQVSDSGSNGNFGM